jgi:hypothetical protein
MAEAFHTSGLRASLEHERPACASVREYLSRVRRQVVKRAQCHADQDLG